MTDKEIESLIESIQQKIANPPSPEESLAMLVKAGILNPDGTFTKQYPLLSKYDAKRKTKH